MLFGAEKSDQLLDFVVGERIAEGRHLLAAVEELAGDFVVGPLLLFADVFESRGFARAFEVGAVAEAAAFVAEENGAGHFGFFFLAGCEGGLRGAQGNEDKDGEGLSWKSHGAHFRMMG